MHSDSPQADYQDKFEDAEDARDAIITRATTATNTFTETRIKGEEDAATAAQDAADEIIKIAEMERDAKIRAAMDYNDAVSELNQDRIDAEMRRADRIVNLEQDTQDRITDIIRDANRTAEDIERDFQRDSADRVRDYNQALGEIFDDTSLSQSQRQDAIAELQRENSELARTQGFDRLQDLEDAGIRTGRRTEDAEIRQLRGERDINAQAEATATAIQDTLTPLLTEQSTLAASQTTAAEMQTTAAEAHTVASEKIIEFLSPQMAAGQGRGDRSVLDILGIAGDIPESELQGYIRTAVNASGGFAGVGTDFESSSDAFLDLRENIASQTRRGLSDIDPLNAEQAARDFLAAAPTLLSDRSEFQSQQPPSIPTVINLERAEIFAETVNLNGEVSGGGGGTGGGTGGGVQKVEVVNTDEMSPTVEMDGKEVAKIVGPNIAQQRNSRRNF